MILCALMGVLGVALEVFALRELLIMGSPWSALALHAGACLLLAWAGARLPSSRRLFPGAKRWLFCLMLSFPVLGIACTAALLGVMLLVPERSSVENRTVVGIPGATGAVAVPVGGNRARSIIQILSSSDTLARRDAVLSLRSEISPAAVLILQRAVGDSDEQVRNYAQSQLAKWTEQAELEVKRLQELAAVPDAPAEVILALAESCRELVSNHLAGAELEKKYLRLSVQSLDRIPAESSVRGNADLLSVSCLLRLQEVVRARAAFDRLVACGYAHELLAGLHLRLLFRERKWEALRDEIKRISQTSVQPLKLWGAPAL